MSDVKISVSNRLGENTTKYRQAEQLLAAILTCIMNTNLSQMTAAISKDDTPTDQVTTKYLYDIPATDAIKAIKWADYANSCHTPAALQQGHRCTAARMHLSEPSSGGSHTHHCKARLPSR